MVQETEADVTGHGSESYFVLGEGLLSESDEGRPEDTGARASAASATATAAAAPPFRFSRLGPKGAGKQLGEPNRRKLGDAMTVTRGGDGKIPAGYTYLGQFIDHDLTFDKTQVTFGASVSPAQLLQGRSPSLDLDSMYGAGPGDPESAKFYADGVKLKTGKPSGAGPAAKAGFDLPRGAGNTQAKKRKAIIPDFRNDENLAVAQTHTAMIRFHNRVVATLPSSVPAAQRFETARELVVKHYQWMIRTDFLPRICTKAVVDDVFNNGRKAFEVGATPTDVPTMPIEFSVGAFRLGHAMVRGRYSWNSNFDFDSARLEDLFTFSATSSDLGGDTALASIWVADFRRLYDFKQAGHANLGVPKAQFNFARRIDTTLAIPLDKLPGGSFGGPSMPKNDPRRNLAFRNLTRARMVKLATGQQMATFLKGKGVSLTTLTRNQLRDGNNGAELGGLTQAQRDAALTKTPLWFYILREAELNGGKLDGVGARIVAETVHRAMEGSTHSIVRDPAFRPSLGPSTTTFKMPDLLFFAFEGKKGLLAPNG
jgi:hypothetical protein